MESQISVIIPLYNKAPYIKRAIDSVLTQTIQNFEIIIVNDGSTDGSEKIVKNYSDSRIQLFNQVNQGVSVARNRGITLANAELVAFLDADDEWKPEFLETVLQLHNKYPHSAVWGTEVIVERGGIYRRFHIKYPFDDEDGVIPSYFRYTACNSHPISIIASLFRKEVLEECGGFNTNMIQHEDYDLLDRIAYNYDIAYSTVPMAVIHANASGFDTRIPKLRDDVQLPFVKYLSKIPEEIQKTHKHYDDVQLYLESLKILTADLRAYHNIHDAHRILKEVKSPELKRLKYILYRDMHLRRLPKPIRLFLSNLWYFHIQKYKHPIELTKSNSREN